MPYSDRSKLKEYQAAYQIRYRENNRAEIKERRARWFQERKETARVLQRVRRWVARCESALNCLDGQDRAMALATVTTWATDPEMPRATVAGLWRQVSESGRLQFIAALPAGGREREKWEFLHV